MLKKILLGLLALLIIIQFFQIDKTNPKVLPDQDFLAITDVPEDIKANIKAACYDCHSHETVYPWYASIQPVGWLLNNHITDGRKHLNFSIWSQYDTGKKDHKLEECAEEVEERHMPIKAYLLTHPEAKLSDAEVNEMVDFFNKARG